VMRCDAMGWIGVCNDCKTLVKVHIQNAVGLGNGMRLSYRDDAFPLSWFLSHQAFLLSRGAPLHLMFLPT